MSDHMMGTPENLEEKIKKATSEMLALFLFNQRDMYVNEISSELSRLSKGAFNISFPYSIVYRLERYGYIQLVNKHVADDGRLRQYYSITREGTKYLVRLLNNYYKMQNGISDILESKGE